MSKYLLLLLGVLDRQGLVRVAQEVLAVLRASFTRVSEGRQAERRKRKGGTPCVAKPLPRTSTRDDALREVVSPVQ